MENLKASENNLNDLDEDLNEIDYVIKTINGKEYKLQLRYKNTKYLKARFGVGFANFDNFDQYLGEIIYSSITSDEGMEKRPTFEKFEEDLNFESLEYLLDIIEDIMKISFPKKFKDLEENEIKEDQNKKK